MVQFIKDLVARIKSFFTNTDTDIKQFIKAIEEEVEATPKEVADVILTDIKDDVDAK